MECYTYILKSRKNGDVYIGSTADIPKRIKLHNWGKVKSRRPINLGNYLRVKNLEQEVRL